MSDEKNKGEQSKPKQPEPDRTITQRKVEFVFDHAIPQPKNDPKK